MRGKCGLEGLLLHQQAAMQVGDRVVAIHTAWRPQSMARLATQAWQERSNASVSRSSTALRRTASLGLSNDGRLMNRQGR